MTFIDNISFVYFDEKPECVYQCKAKYPQILSGGVKYLPEQELGDHYYNFIYSPIILTQSGEQITNNQTDKIKFLEYHLQKYKGDPLNFFDFVEWSLDFVKTKPYFKTIEHNKDRVDKYIKDWINKMKNALESKIDNWIYFLRQFIDTATRWSIETVYASVNDRYGYSAIFQPYYIENCREYWELFKKELRQKELELSSDRQIQSFYNQLDSEFNPGIQRYLNWYNNNHNETLKFDPYNPYKIFYEYCKDTKDEIERLNGSKPKQKQTPIDCFKSDLSIQQLKYLYKQFTQTHQFINDLKTDEGDFIDVFSKPFSEHDSRIYFSEETTQIAYIFYRLRSRFTELYKCIGESKKFISKDNTVIKSNNISSQLSKTVKRGIPVKNDHIIDDIIKNLPE